jgi:hypothetical protein
MIQKVLDWFKSYKDFFKYALYGAIGLFALYGFIFIVSLKPNMPAEIKAQIDSLNAVNKQLIERQKQIDSTIKVYEAEVEQVDFQIDNIKEKTTIIREYYHEVGQQASQYNPTQVDSFFKARYNY